MYKIKRVISITLAVLMIFTSMPMVGGLAKATEKKGVVQTYETSKTFDKDKVTVNAATNGTSIKITGNTLFTKASKVNFFLRSVNKSDEKKYAETSTVSENGKFSIEANTKDLPKGEYYVLCRFDKNWDYFFRDVTYKKGTGNGGLVEYTDVLENNKNMIEKGKNYSPEIYKDKTLKHDFVVNNKALTTEQMKVIDAFTDEVVKGASTNYDKLKKMYEYLGNNIYYDTDAFNDPKLQSVIHPYELVKSIKAKNKVKTVCDGYSALMIAMARSEGIPCRLVQGTVRTTPNQSWENVGTKTNHTWVEAYVDGRWVIIDATRSTNKRYEGKQWIVANDEATVKGLARYQYFDPSIEFFSNAYRYKEYRNGSLDVIASNTTEYKSLQGFLTRNNNENGKKVNSNFKANDMSTWYNSKAIDSTNDIETNGFGNAKLISWQNKGLVGSMNLSGLSQLKNLLIHSNNITALENLNDCVNLEQISANFNKITSLKADKVKKLRSIKLQNNLLDIAEFNTVRGKSITINSSDKTKGTFSFVYDGVSEKESLVIKAYAKEGVDFLGCYDENGEKVIVKTVESNAAQGGVYYEFNLDPSKAGKYTLKFEYIEELSVPKIDAKLVGSIVKVSWNKISGATGYEIYRATSKTGKYTKISDAPANWISLNNSSVEKGKTYYYKMRAVKAEANGTKTYSKYSQVVFVKIPGEAASSIKTPTNIRTEGVNSTTIRVLWNGVSGAKGYQIYRATVNKASAFKRVNTVSSKYRSVQNKGLVTGKTYYWKIRAYKVVNGKTSYSPFSKVVSRKTVLSTPRILKVEKVSSTKMKIKWSGVTGATKYQIYRATVNNSKSYKLVSTASSKSRYLINSNLKKGRTYYWKVRAYKIVNGKKVYSNYSKVVKARIK